MACIPPFNDPYQNALAYLRTQGAITSDMVPTRKFGLYLERLQRQVLKDFNIGDALFTKHGSKITPNFSVFEQIRVAKGEGLIKKSGNPEATAYNPSVYREGAKLRNEDKSLADSDNTWLSPDERDYMNDLAKQGRVEFKCAE